MKKKIALRGRMPHGIKNGLKIKVKLYSCFLFIFLHAVCFILEIILFHIKICFSALDSESAGTLL